MRSIEPKKKHVIIGTTAIVTAVLLFLSAIAFVTYATTKKSTPVSFHRTHQSPDLATYKMSGKVTRIDQNGRDFMLDENGDKFPGPGYAVTDGGDIVYVDNQSIQTSSGGAGVKDQFYTNIDSIKLGDTVLVYYALGSNGEKTLDCKTCYIGKQLYTEDGKPFDKVPMH